MEYKAVTCEGCHKDFPVMLGAHRSGGGFTVPFAMWDQATFYCPGCGHETRCRSGQLKEVRFEAIPESILGDVQRHLYVDRYEIKAQRDAEISHIVIYTISKLTGVESREVVRPPTQSALGQVADLLRRCGAPDDALSFEAAMFRNEHWTLILNEQQGKFALNLH